MLGDQNSHRASLQVIGQTVVELAALALACLCGSLQSLERWTVACLLKSCFPITAFVAKSVPGNEWVLITVLVPAFHHLQCIICYAS